MNLYSICWCVNRGELRSGWRDSTPLILASQSTLLSLHTHLFTSYSYKTGFQGTAMAYSYQCVRVLEVSKVLEQLALTAGTHWNSRWGYITHSGLTALEFRLVTRMVLTLTVDLVDSVAVSGWVEGSHSRRYFKPHMFTARSIRNSIYYMMLSYHSILILFV